MKIMPAFPQKLIYVLSASLWLGGLTFYALVVVPAGTEVVGSTKQGFITEQVTSRLNVVGVVSLAGLLLSTVHARRRSLWTAWTLMAAAQTALFVMHSQLGELLDRPTLSVPDPARFYSLHRIYLLTTALQWTACLWHLSETVWLWHREPTPT